MQVSKGAVYFLQSLQKAVDLLDARADVSHTVVVV